MPYISSFERMAMEKGEVRGLKKGIALVLEVKFGETGLQLAAEVQQISDLGTLRRVLASIEAAASPDDVRRVWSA
jgi:hypothetical protein